MDERTRRKTPARLARAVRSLAAEARHLPDRLLHARRRRRAIERVGRLAPRSFLFICHGNICRSPYAAARFGQLVDDDSAGGARVASAGFIGPDRPSPETACEVAAGRSVALEEHRSALLSPEAARDSDLLVVMTRWQARAIRRRFRRDPDPVLLLGDLDPEPIRRRDIRDPIEQPAEVFEEVFARIDRCLEVMIDAIVRAEPR